MVSHPDPMTVGSPKPDFASGAFCSRAASRPSVTFTPLGGVKAKVLADGLSKLTFV
jgi:hypothetical protein